MNILQSVENQIEEIQRCRDDGAPVGRTGRRNRTEDCAFLQ